MKINYITLAIVFSVTTLLAQKIDMLEYSRNINWGNYTPSKELEKEFLTQITQKCEREGKTLSFSELYSKLYAIDVNGDSLKDIIYQGPNIYGPVEGFYTEIFINKQNEFVSALYEMGEIFNFSFDKECLSALYLANGGCCGSPETELLSLATEVITDKIIVEKEFESFYVQLCGLALPEKRLEHKLRIIVNSEAANLRASAEIDNEECCCGFSGNIVGSINKGTEGYAIASSIDNTGRTWYFSAFPVKSNVLDKRRYSVNNRYILGWISSRTVKIKVANNI